MIALVAQAGMFEELALRFTLASIHVLWVGALIWLVVFAADRLWVSTPAGRHGVCLLGVLGLLVSMPVCFLSLPPVPSLMRQPAQRQQQNTL